MTHREAKVYLDPAEARCEPPPIALWPKRYLVGEVDTMTTDRELLELAAKAAGLELSCYQSNDEKAPLWLDRKHANPVTHSMDWNPLTDDGDALRLAVKLHIATRYDPPSYRSEWSAVARSLENNYATEFADDLCAAARRAIVRAAAEIGRAA